MHGWWFRVAAVTAALLLAGSAAMAADWVSRHGRQVAFGAGDQVRLAGGVPAGSAPRTFRVPGQVTGALLLGARLTLILDGDRLTLLELGRPAGAPRELPVPGAEGELHLAVLGRGLTVVDERGGLWIVGPGAAHAGGGGTGVARPSGRLPLDGRVTAAAGSGHTLLAALEGGDLVSFHVGDTAVPLPQARWAVGAPVQALSADGARAHVLTASGLEVWDRSTDAPALLWSDPGVRGRGIAVAGRSIEIAAGDRGLLTVRDTRAGPIQVNVTVGNNFFSPAEVSLDPGDSVRWQNASGFHNVFSCVVAQNGCQVDSNETFTSGVPTFFWQYTYTFTEPGENPYICQPHAPSMIGLVSVRGGEPGPPPVPSGPPGIPMTARLVELGTSRLALYWDDATCGAPVDHHVLFGFGADLPPARGDPFGTAGGLCSLGPRSPALWEDVPSPGAGDLLWWLLVAADAAGVEGPWGTGSDGLERVGPATGGASGVCGAGLKDASGSCE